MGLELLRVAVHLLLFPDALNSVPSLSLPSLPSSVYQALVCRLQDLYNSPHRKTLELNSFRIPNSRIGTLVCGEIP